MVGFAVKYFTYGDCEEFILNHSRPTFILIFKMIKKPLFLSLLQNFHCTHLLASVHKKKKNIYKGFAVKKYSMFILEYEQYFAFNSTVVVITYSIIIISNFIYKLHKIIVTER